MFSNSNKQKVTTKNAEINIFKGDSSGPALLLLHGYPQTSFMWHKIADKLTRDFTVVAADLRGYGESSKLPGKEDHSNYSKRAMAEDMVEVMSQLGHEQFYLAGHDRGGRVAHRLALDYPAKVKKLAVLDIVPTYLMYATTDKEFAEAYYHWFFLIQPFPLPETLIEANAEFFLKNCLQRWSKDENAFTEQAKEEYKRCFCNYETIHSTCEDYRASATIDLEHDRHSLDKKISCPMLALWGGRTIVALKYNVLECWQQRAMSVEGKEIDCGHFLPEEAPLDTYLALVNFFKK